MAALSNTTTAADGAKGIAALAIAPATQPSANSRRALIASARFNSALTSVPATNPPCTAIVSHGIPALVIPNSAAIAGAAAVAENQSVIPRKSPVATSDNMRRGIDESVTVTSRSRTLSRCTDSRKISSLTTGMLRELRDSFVIDS